MTGEDLGDAVSGVDGPRPVPRGDRPRKSDPATWPKFAGDARPAPRPFGGALDRPRARAELTAEAMADPELEALVRRQTVNAFDNRPPAEAATLFARLWARGPIKSVRKLVEAALDAADVEAAYLDGMLSDERAVDEMRVCRSRVRMYGKDGEVLPNPDGSPASDMWGSLDDDVPWRWRP